MVSRRDIWPALKAAMNEESWTSLDELYRAVEKALPAVSEESSPRWRRNVRNVLQHRRARGEVAWNGHGAYKLSRSP
jgi:hypothetical protein